MEETKPSAPSLYPNISEAASRITSFSEQYINDKILAHNEFNNQITFMKDFGNYYNTENNNYKKSLSRYKKYINIAEILLSSIATTATRTSVQ